jgi:uncharacterized protein (TIGR03437 family)
VNRAWPALAAALLGAAWGQDLSYSAAGIVNAADYSPGPFAPNSVVSLFGLNLARGTTAATADSIRGNMLPSQLGGTSVYVDNIPAPLFYASPGQVNFLIPSNLIPHNAAVRVVRDNVTGPSVAVTIAAAAPALFIADGYALAQDWNANNALATASAPAHSGDTIVLYATGLGATQPNPAPGEIPHFAAAISSAASLRILLGGAAIDPSLVKYAGLTPGWAGLYQVNFILPTGLAPDPEVVVTVGGQASAPGLKLAVR